MSQRVHATSRRRSGKLGKAAAQIHEDCEEVRNIIMSKPKSEREAYIGDAVMEPGFSLELPGFLERQCVSHGGLIGAGAH